ncbi:MAG: GNAT family N-acetyltransferase [Alphaproteobacteria bacterium]|jgi:GNAT superfamily N-acetyltransferase|nr:GNAT family N-acetyltransferase [Alphaproteobacteria bacterium]MBU2042251.1 GNAT family N-acetyltransferase [Alphaproteobacteria bacterium]MBU2126050.1 GNAT family N-acetyltransferase [Alphaproteobacteria bacterium]MBU2209276.1 GNAT family N-acetyltransferase [Alphaproteobacteria bacterium]MBU2290436.1 GNAT family N-acetyltransferase [Alphaproteobacteria bacterium]
MAPAAGPVFTPRIATEADIPGLVALMDRSIAGPLAAFLTPDQIAASRKLMGIDSQLIADRTYFIVETDGVMAGCGGWSGRITEYGGDHTPGRTPAPLTPGVDAARIRAMYTAPGFVRRGVGRLILSLCEEAARAAGYDRAELVATMGGEPLYRAAGYVEIERFEDDRGGTPVPLVRMGKRLTADPSR